MNGADCDERHQKERTTNMDERNTERTSDMFREKDKQQADVMI